MDNKNRTKPQSGQDPAIHYNENVKEHAASGRSRDAAERARQEVDGPQGEELRRAEREGKSHRADTPATPKKTP